MSLLNIDGGKAKKMRTMFAERRAVRFPGAYDALSAKMIEAAGFEGLQVSGYGLAGSLYGLPDIDIMPLERSLEATERITRAVDIPVMADVDTGGGGPLSVVALGLADSSSSVKEAVKPTPLGHCSRMARSVLATNSAD